jgi:hypothetical protein
MTPADRHFTYRRRIKVSGEDLALAKSGRKTCTIRLGTATVDGEFIDLTDGRDTLRVRIVAVETARYRALGQEHAQCEGFSSVEELRKDLEKYYRRIDNDQTVTVIKFERVSA